MMVSGYQKNISGDDIVQVEIAACGKYLSLMVEALGEKWVRITRKDFEYK